MTAEDILEEIKARLRATSEREIPSHCHCCPNPYEEGLETEAAYASDLLDDISKWETEGSTD